MVGAHLDRLTYRLQQQLWETAIKLNNTAKYSGANRIKGTPAIDITRRPVYESDGNGESNGALTISCKSSCAEILKTLLVHADLEKNEFGIFMQQSTKMTNKVLHKTMYQEHLAFSQDLIAIPVEGLHLEVLEEMVRLNSGTGEAKLVQDVLLATKREGISPKRAIEYTTRSTEEGRFIFVTDSAGSEGVKSIIENELQILAQKTMAFARHLNDNEHFTHGVRLATKWMTQTERHESGVLARQGAWQGDERSQTRQSRNRVIVIESPWSLDDHPLLATGNGNQASGETATYTQMAAGQFHQQAQQHSQHLHTQSFTGRTSPTNRSTTSELGFDDAATIQSLISTVAEQSERMQVQSAQIQAQSAQMQVLLEGHENFKINLEAAVALRIQDQHDRHMATIEDMEVRQKQRETEHKDKLQAQEERLQDELREMIRQFDDRDQALHEAKVLADEQQRRRDVEINEARIEERRIYDSKVDSLTKKSDDTLSMLSAMRQMMEAAAQAAVAQQIPQQMVLPTPPRRQTTARQSLPSQVELDVDMEDTSQLTNTLSGSQGQDQSQKLGADEVFSPPRIAKKRQASRPASSLNTKETQASTASYGSNNRQGTNPSSFGLITQLDHDEAVKMTMGVTSNQDIEGTLTQINKSGVETLAPRSQQEREELLSRLDGDHEGTDQWPQQEKESDKPTRELMEPRTQQDHEETLALSGTAPTAEALAKFSVEHEGNDHERQRVTEAGMTRSKDPTRPRRNHCIIRHGPQSGSPREIFSGARRKRP
jgi:predicted DNA-binding WGR domain protein